GQSLGSPDQSGQSGVAPLNQGLTSPTRARGGDMRLGLSDRARRGRGIVPLVAVAGALVLAGGCFLGTDPVTYPRIGVPLDVADLNGDGHLDIVSCSGALLNDGTGAYPTSVPGVDPACGTDAATGDVDGDGHVDRVVLHNEPFTGRQRISLYPGD